MPFLYSATSLNPNGPVSVSLGNGVEASWSYDPLGRQDGLGLTLGGTPLYAYMANWSGRRVSSSVDTVNDNGSYSYDDLNRLQSATLTTYAGTMNLGWTYDRYNNRLSQTASGSYMTTVNQPSYSVDSTTNRISSSGYQYDAAGNLYSDGANSYSYDAEGNLIGIAGSSTSTYLYDALNERVMTMVNGVTQVYGFNISNERASIWDGDGNEISAQYYAGPKPLAYWLASDSHVRFQHQDWIGTERIRTSYTGSVEGAFGSLPFGDSQVQAWGSDTDAYHYAGLDADSSDLQHAQFREYSTAEGRWLRPDPYDGSYHLLDPQSFNRYTYARNNPLNYRDPSGLDIQTITVCQNYTANVDGENTESWTECEDEEVDVPEESTGGGGGGGGGGASGNSSTTSSAPSKPAPYNTTSGICLVGNCKITIYYGTNPFGNVCSGVTGGTVYSVWDCQGAVSSCAANQGQFRDACYNQGQTPLVPVYGFTGQGSGGSFYYEACCSITRP